MSATIWNGESRSLSIETGKKLTVAAMSGTYSVLTTAGAGAGTALATNATGGTYGPYAGPITVLLSSSALSEIDFDVAVTPVIESDTFVKASKTLTGGVSLSAAGKDILPAAKIRQAHGTTNISASNARVSSAFDLCSFPTPYSAITNELTHPSVIFSETGFAGHRYWCAYTPYPNTNDQYENPCIAYSDDGINWSLPQGAPNPVIENPFPGSGYQSDPDIAIGPDGDMYMLSRYTNTGNGHEGFYLSTSGDGVKWTNPVVLADYVTATNMYVSPSLLWNGSAWEVYAHDLKAVAYALVKWTLPSLTETWGAPAAVTMANPAGNNWWHSEVRILPNGKRVILAQDNQDSGQLYFGESTDGGASFGVVKFISSGVGFWFYRSTFCISTDDVGNSQLELWLSQNGTRAWDDWRVFRATATFDRAAFNLARASQVASALASASLAPSRLLFADNFNRADNAAAVGSPLLGSAYTISAGAWGILSNQIYSTTAGNARIFATLSTGDFEQSVILSEFTYAVGMEIWLWGRAVDANNGWRWGYKQNTIGLRLQKIVSGAAVIDIEVPGCLAPGDEIGMVCRGSLVSVTKNGVIIGSSIDTSFSAATIIGIQRNVVSLRFDDWVAWKAL